MKLFKVKFKLRVKNVKLAKKLPTSFNKQRQIKNKT